jgi:uncharacterized LabA/DUF88 family protein
MNVFLIDADNLNLGAWIDEAFRVLEQSEGHFAVRRAYGSAENLKGLAEPLRAWAVRPFVNLSLTKNTTDIALAVDAMEFACQSPAPRMVVIGSGDADFLPLVVRLRERGIRMVCVSERSKMGREAISAYDRVILVGQEQALQKDHSSTVDASPLDKPVGRRATTAKKTAAKKAPAAKTPAKKAAVKKVPDEAGLATAARSGARAVERREPAVVDSPANPPHASDVDAILSAVPSLRSGQPHSLAAVARALLDARLRGKNMTATKLLKKFPQQFALLPPEKPRTVTYTPAPDMH